MSDCADYFDLTKVFLWVSAAAGIITFIVTIYRVNKDDSEFRAVDLILEGTPARASVNKLILVVFAALSVWVVVLSVLDNKIDGAVSSLLLGVLGIFVVGRAVGQGINTYANTQVRKTEINSGMTKAELDETRPSEINGR